MLTKVRIVCISDTHNAAPGQGYTLPKGDILIHAGDLTNQGSHTEMKKAVQWLTEVDFEVKIVVAGNHDLSLDREYTLKHKEGWSVMPQDVADIRESLTSESSIVYLQHVRKDVLIPSKGVTLRVFGSPYSHADTNKRQNWAFQYAEDDADACWSNITSDIDLLITHSPPRGHCDTSRHWQGGGCPTLARTISRVRPLLHVCGHCHEGRGVEIIEWNEQPSSSSTTEQVSRVLPWEDPGKNSKKQSLLDLTGRRGYTLQAGETTAVVNASITARSFGHGTKTYNKPIVVDILLEGTGT
ncbi:Metallo-dependent phosphatase [Dissoconium aciculare CBS 342.82]|uniref:Metallo-dependent phosphatase n=1 Tax=Dissoconium aciculare CBS 342.82 TaxID=1314786 RepID=A0A6J3M9R8_9PEZI|nr:Metallo-dependent phosphatase [Dissoconium aciculare CBS 342.82]KAF1823557.1 Metallo-dependent phosphatase [Dissoconium aciculare CBS 342.82]